MVCPTMGPTGTNVLKVIFWPACSIQKGNNLRSSLQNLWFLLDKHHTPPMVGEDQMINYEDFLKVATEAGPKCK